MKSRDLSYERQKQLVVHYKSQKLNNRFCADLVVEDKVLIEMKAIKVLVPRVEAQLLNYLKITQKKVGLVFNFGGPRFEFIRRVL